MKNYNLTNIKTKRSRNGYAMSATFQINGIDVATFEDKGDGSAPGYCIYCNPDALKLAAEFDSDIEMLPELFIEQYGMNIKIDIPMFIDMLHAAIVNKTEFKLLAA